MKTHTGYDVYSYIVFYNCNNEYDRMKTIMYHAYSACLSRVGVKKL